MTDTEALSQAEKRLDYLLKRGCNSEEIVDEIFFYREQIKLTNDKINIDTPNSEQ